MVEQLIIIGNGFDVNCGLKSSYDNWYKSRFAGRGYFRRFLKQFMAQKVGHNANSDYSHRYEQNEIEAIVDSDFTVPRSEQKVTAWDILLLSERKNSGNWKSIEEFIEATVQNVSALSFSESDWFGLTEHVFLDGAFPKLRNSIATETSINAILRLLALRYPKQILNSSYGLMFNRGDSEATLKPSNLEDSMLRILLDELRILESEFTQYLSDQVDKTKDYEEKAHELLSRIIGNSNIEYNSTAILSFNYTNPFPDIQQLFNVHGTLWDNNIIFGIDKQDADKQDTTHASSLTGDTKNVLDNGQNTLPFTKTYRKLFNPPTGALVNCKGAKVVKFYGHSLGRMDYSYFLAVFDSLSIYDGEQNLTFFYSIHDDNRKSAIKNARFKEVTGLIDRYGSTFSNVNRGKNLMHRLMLEGRLGVTDIDEISPKLEPEICKEL